MAAKYALAASERLSDSPHVELKGIGWCLNERIWPEGLTLKYAMLKLMTKTISIHLGWFIPLVLLLRHRA